MGLPTRHRAGRGGDFAPCAHSYCTARSAHRRRRRADRSDGGGTGRRLRVSLCQEWSMVRSLGPAPTKWTIRTSEQCFGQDLCKKPIVSKEHLTTFVGDLDPRTCWESLTRLHRDDFSAKFCVDGEALLDGPDQRVGARSASQMSPLVGVHDGRLWSVEVWSLCEVARSPQPRSGEADGIMPPSRALRSWDRHRRRASPRPGASRMRGAPGG